MGTADDRIRRAELAERLKIVKQREEIVERVRNEGGSRTKVEKGKKAGSQGLVITSVFHVPFRGLLSVDRQDPRRCLGPFVSLFM